MNGNVGKCRVKPAGYDHPCLYGPPRPASEAPWNLLASRLCPVGRLARYLCPAEGVCASLARDPRAPRELRSPCPLCLDPLDFFPILPIFTCLTKKSGPISARPSCGK
jgi:hypothetical protein